MVIVFLRHRIQTIPQKTPPGQAAKALRLLKGIGSVHIYNNGKNGSSTFGHLPQAKSLYNETVMVADRFYKESDKLLIFFIKLGTNDSATEGVNSTIVTCDQFKANLKTIVDSLLFRYPKCIVVLNHPIWYSPNTYNGAKYLQEGLTRLKSFMPVIDALVLEYTKQNTKVYLGDTKGFAYFKKNYLTDMIHENGKKGVFYLHPNEKGSKELGELWAKRIYKIIMKLN